MDSDNVKLLSRKLCTVCELKKSWSYLLRIHNNFKKLGKAQGHTKNVHPQNVQIQKIQDSKRPGYTERPGFKTSSFIYFIKNEEKFYFRKSTCTGTYM